MLLHERSKDHITLINGLDIMQSHPVCVWPIPGSGIARSQTTPGHCTCLFLFCVFFFCFGLGGGGGGACILGVATQIVFETIFEMPSVLNW